ncbi:8-amino-7-oxononanoate synthase [Bremerella sp. JC817]|uniref:8-amino-7-oxononanoate synthase n=1 Tax=Bremerella sp. JC817 TaxID=3231756 RepID=UPI00345A16C6
MFDPLSWIPEQLELLNSLERRRAVHTRATQQGATIIWKDGTLLNFSSNDYLNLAADPRLQEAAQLAIAREGWGSGASPLITGRGEAQTALEEALAKFEGTEAALTFASGFAANAGTIDALTDRGDVILSDEKNHASIIDGTRLSKATVRVYPHRDVAYLENLLKQCGTFRRRLIVTDTLFSMDGTVAPLDQLADLAEKYEAMLMVDEAHATGVFGQQGRGLCEQYGIEDRVPIRVGTFSKALGGHGGFVVGSRALVDWLVNRSRPYIFSTAAPAANAAAMLASLEIIQQEPERRVAVLAMADQLRVRLRELGWSLGDSQTQIIPVIVGTEGLAMDLSARLLKLGIMVPGIRPPSVPEGECLLRISLSFGHSQQHLDTLVDAMAKIRP